MPLQTTKNVAYDNATSITRQFWYLGVSVAGASATCAQYFALGNETLWAAHAVQRAAGTSTFTTTNTFITTGGTSTTVVNTNTAATTFQAFRVNVTGTTTTTTTFGLAVSAVANSTNGADARHNFVACGTATNGTGGTNLAFGDQIYMVLSTDATGTILPGWEMSVTPLGNITA